jgi:VWFA-related protein
VSNLQPGTPIAILVLTSKLLMLQGFTSDPRLLKAALTSPKTMRSPDQLTSQMEFNARQETSRAIDMNVTTPAEMLEAATAQANIAAYEANEKAFQDQERAQWTLDGLNQLGRYLAGFPGRKNLIWFSGSFPINMFPQGDVSTAFSGMPSMVAEYRETTNLLTTSQIAVYPIDARGLFGNAQNDASGNHGPVGTNTVAASASPINPNGQARGGLQPLSSAHAYSAAQRSFSEQTATEQTTMRLMATATGGKAYLNTNDLTGAVQDVMHTGASYYTLTYSPTNKKQDGRFRKLKVDMEERGYRLSYREGYFAASDKLHTTPVEAHGAASVSGTNVAMKSAMRRGAPQPTQIYLATSFAPVGDAGVLSPELAAGNSAAPTVKGPYRLYRLVLSADPSSITAVPNGTDKVDLGIEFVALVYNAEGVLQTSTGKILRGALAKAKYEEILKTGVQYGLDISVPAKGDFYIRTGVHDLASDRVGALEVPASLIATTAPTERK